VGKSVYTFECLRFARDPLNEGCWHLDTGALRFFGGTEDRVPS